jgi:hypothetical protein
LYVGFWTFIFDFGSTDLFLVKPVYILASLSGSHRLTASSALPYRRAPPTWLKTTPHDVVDQIQKLARKGLTPSQIGVTLRDSHGIPQVRFVTGNKILRILKGQGKLLSSVFTSSRFPKSLTPTTLPLMSIYIILSIHLLTMTSDRFGSFDPRRSLAFDQKGRRCPQTP